MKNNKPKMSRKERERRMIAEMDAAFLEQKFPEESVKKSAQESERVQAEKNPKQSEKAKDKNSTQKLHCPRCKSVMEEGKCPTCGHYIYVPMDKEKRNKIRLIVGGICMVGFVILFVLMQIKK